MDFEQEPPPNESSNQSEIPIFSSGHAGIGYGKYCGFCGNGPDEEEFGRFFHDEESGVSVHQYCMFFASGLPQGGQDTEGFDGFLIPDILRELQRGYRLNCKYCSKRKACVGCVSNHCRKTFHYLCGKKNGAIFQFFGSFNAYCCKHRPQQRLSSAGRLCFSGTSYSTCSICLMPVEAWTSLQTLKTPCCKNAWFHRECVQKQAIASGYFFRCAMCNNTEKFQEEMKRMGIYIPEKDAAWEEGEAYSELLQKYSHCDSEVCLSTSGRSHNQEAGKWQVIVCYGCGQHGTHVVCQGWELPPKRWLCSLCLPIFGTLPESDNEDEKFDPGECVRIGEETESDVEVDIEGIADEIPPKTSDGKTSSVDQPSCSAEVPPQDVKESDQDVEYSRKTSRFKSYRLKGKVEPEEDSDNYFYETLFEDVLNKKCKSSTSDLDMLAKPRIIESLLDTNSLQEVEECSDFFSSIGKSHCDPTKRTVGGRKFRKMTTTNAMILGSFEDGKEIGTSETKKVIFESFNSNNSIVEHNGNIDYQVQHSPGYDFTGNGGIEMEFICPTNGNPSWGDENIGLKTSHLQDDFKFVSPIGTPLSLRNQNGTAKRRKSRVSKKAVKKAKKQERFEIKMKTPIKHFHFEEKSENAFMDAHNHSPYQNKSNCPLPPSLTLAPSSGVTEGLSETVKQAIDVLAKALGNHETDMMFLDDIVDMASDSDSDVDEVPEQKHQEADSCSSTELAVGLVPPPMQTTTTNDSKTRQTRSCMNYSLKQFDKLDKSKQCVRHHCFQLLNPC